MNSKIRCLIVLFMSFGALLAADDFLVAYAEGAVEYRRGASWKPVAVGDFLPESAEVRVGANGLLELRRKSDSLTIYRSGTYLLKTFAHQARERKSSRLFAGVDAKIKSLAGAGSRRGKSAAAGVKAEAMEKPSTDLSWSGDEDDAVPEGLALITAEKYREAAEYFLAALASDREPAAETELYYYLAFACDRGGETARALKYADKIALDPADPRFPDYALLKGSLYAKGFSFDKALDVLTRYLTAFPRGDNAQDALLLAAWCYRNTGDVARERESLKQAVTLDPASDAGKQAAAELK